jgi:hypothetical protein
MRRLAQSDGDDQFRGDSMCGFVPAEGVNLCWRGGFDRSSDTRTASEAHLVF